MKYFLSVLFAMFLTLSSLLGQGIDFEQGSWQEIQDMAKSENKPIVVDAFTTWCGPCKYMSAKIFTLDNVGTFFNENYISYKLDMEKGEGIGFASTYQVQAYPTLLFFDTDAKMVHRFVGATRSGEELIEIGKDALDPNKQIYTLKERFEGGEREAEFLRHYANTLNQANEDASEVIASYFEQVDPQKWVEAKNYALITRNIYDLNSKVFQYVASNSSQFEEAGHSVDEYIEDVLGVGLISALRSPDTTSFSLFTMMLDENFPSYAGKFKAKGRALTHAQDSNGHQYMHEYLSLYSTNWEELNGVAWQYFELEENEKRLLDALSWVEKSIAITKNWYNLDTKSALLYKLKKFKEAESTAHEAIQSGEEEGVDVEETKALLAEIQKRISASETDQE